MIESVDYKDWFINQPRIPDRESDEYKAENDEDIPIENELQLDQHDLVESEELIVDDEWIADLGISDEEDEEPEPEKPKID